MAFKYPSASNTFIPDFEATGVIVSATRDPAQFKLAKYMQYVTVSERVFYYLKLDLEEPARVVNTQDYAWAPGQDAPQNGNVGDFQFVQSSTTKYAYPWVLPQEAIDQAAWDIQASQTGIVQQKMMTNRTILAATLLQTASNWPSANTATVNSLNAGAGKWDTASSDPASANYLAIKKSITAAMTTVILQTNATMKWADYNLVVDPYLAKAMGNSSELYDYVKGSPDARGRQKGTDGDSSEFGAPPEYAGVDIVVEDAVRVSSKPNVGASGTSLGTSGTRGFVWNSSSPTLLGRKGGVTAQYGGSSLSTVQMYFYREGVVYTKSDPDNERTMGRVVDDLALVLPYGQSGFMFQQAL